MILQGLIAREQFVSQHRENSARQAFAWGQFDSTGWGQLAYPDVLNFGLTFIDEPIVSYGFSVEEDEALDRLPLSTGGVFKWRRDGRGYYTGAHVYVVVDQFVQPSETPDYSQLPTLIHSFLFTGIAIKDIGPDQFRDD